jgi:putative peptidoglycan lipid II flippase
MLEQNRPLHHSSPRCRFPPLTANGLTAGEAAATPTAAAAPSHPQASLRAIGIVTALTLLQLALQFALQLVLANYFGAAGDMDAYVAALAPPVVIATILSGSLGYVLVPVVTQRLAAGRTEEAAAVASQIGLCVTIVAIAVTVGIALAAAPLAALLCPGFSSERQAQVASLLRILSTLTLFNTLISYLNSLSHCYRQFARPALGGVLGTLATLAYVIALHSSQGVFAVAWGVVVGAALTVLFLLPLFLSTLLQSARLQRRLLPATRQSFQLLLPLVLAAIYWRLDPLLDRWLGSYLAEGSIAHMGYAWRLVSGLSLVGTSGLSIVAFQALAAHASAGRRAELCAELAYALRLFLFLVVPVCVGLVAFAAPVVRLLCERGRFTSEDTRVVATLVILYVGVIFGTGLSDLLSRTCYALQDMLTPVLVTTGVFTLIALVKIALARQGGAPTLVAATSGYYLLTTIVLLFLLVARLSPAMLAGCGPQLLRSIACSLAASFAAALVIRLDFRLAILPAAACGALVYCGGMWFFGDEFARRIGRRAQAILWP